jgi:hypothetical protein
VTDKTSIERLKIERAGVAAGSKMFVGEDAKALVAGRNANQTRLAIPARVIFPFPPCEVRNGQRADGEKDTGFSAFKKLSISKTDEGRDLCRTHNTPSMCQKV